MKIPKYIQVLIDQRERYAIKYVETDYQLSEWLDKHNIMVMDYDIYGGCESIVNPTDSANRIKEAIKNS